MNISEKMTVNPLLAAFPQLQNVLVDLNPQFNKLKNPLLRNTVGRVATFKQAASVANIPVLTLVNLPSTELPAVEKIRG
jgi:uncharacterized protein